MAELCRTDCVGSASARVRTVLILLATGTVNQNRMKVITAAVSSICLALLAMGCASNKGAQQRGWIGGELLVAKRPSWRIPILLAFAFVLLSGWFIKHINGPRV